MTFVSVQLGHVACLVAATAIWVGEGLLGAMVLSFAMTSLLCASWLKWLQLGVVVSAALMLNSVREASLFSPGSWSLGSICAGVLGALAVVVLAAVATNAPSTGSAGA